ncbi:MAG: alpha/beta hydrolase [Alphaproteobacteria bacterium]|nr:alpha/beta hydrolase [Alphaproteobacteria bacterium]
MVDFPEPEFIRTNGIRMAVHTAGPEDGVPVVLCHGFPELAYSWRFQIPALAEAGYRVFAPDQRGYGETGAPEGVEEYDIHNLTADLCGLLDHYGLEDAVFVGHDWGALVVWQMPLLHPKRVRGLASCGIPFMPRTDTDPVEMFRAMWGEKMYIVHFQQSHEADEYFGEHPEDVFNVLMRRPSMSRDEFDALPQEDKLPDLLARIKDPRPSGEALLSDEERDVFVNSFRKSGFTGPINWYRNWSRNWRTTVHVPQKIDAPCLFIGAGRDFLVAPQMMDVMKAAVPQVETHVVEDSGHWLQQEYPDEVNRVLIEWLQRSFG